MIASSLALVVASLLCLAYDTTRSFGIAGIFLLLYLYPWSFLALLILGGAVLFAIRRYHYRRKHHAVSRLRTRRD